MKKITQSLLSASLLLSLFINLTSVQAVDFSGKETYYIKLCSSAVTRSNQKTCREFNSYLRKKNANLKNEISKNKKELENTKDDIAEVNNKITKLNKRIKEKEAEIKYIESSIKKVENNIKKKEKLMRDRLYAMQTYYNSNIFVDFLFGASSFTDFFSRLNSINDITAYEKELVADLTLQKKDLSEQKKTLKDARAALQSEKQSAVSLQKKLLALQAQQQNTIAANQSSLKTSQKAQQEVDQELKRMERIFAQQDSGGSAVQGSQGNAKVGYAVANAALSKLGSAYYWGASGPNMFDCSGLVYWAHRQAGVSIGRTTANDYARAGKQISASQLQAGDIVAFRSTGSSRYHHIAIYIGNGTVVHASGEGSTCLGNHVSRGHVVKRAPLSSFSSYAKSYRRLY